MIPDLPVIVCVDNAASLEVVNQSEAAGLLIVGHQGKYLQQSNSTIDDLHLIQLALDTSDLLVFAPCRAGHSIDAEILSALKVDSVIEIADKHEFSKTSWLDARKYSFNLFSVARLEDCIQHYGRGVKSLLVQCEDINKAIMALAYYQYMVNKIIATPEVDYLEIAKHYEVDITTVRNFIKGGYRDLKIYVELEQLNITDSAMLARYGVAGLVVREDVFERSQALSFINALVSAFYHHDDPVKLATICETCSVGSVSNAAHEVYDGRERKFDIAQFASNELTSID